MTRSNNRRTLLAGATATALLTLGVFAGSAGASAAPATIASASAMDSGSRAPADFVFHPFALYIDNTLAEYLAGVEGLSGNQVTLVRGATRGQALDNLINLPAGLRKNFSVQVLDSNGNPVKTYSFANAQPIRYDGTNATFQFSRIIVS
ncbi:hypothetical protein ACWEO4_13245 [Streptomyces sp. NPDC004393]|uniref:hypothetical protein n=1 Tax=Streptomyces sp. NPDC004533 TaxID=3154278 RepID=UPI0033AB63DB